MVTEGTVQQCGTLELSRLPPANQERQIQARFCHVLLLCSVVVVVTRDSTKTQNQERQIQARLCVLLVKARHLSVC